MIRARAQRRAPTTFMTVPDVTSGGEQRPALDGLCRRTTRRAASSTSTTRVTEDGAIQVDEFQRSAADPNVGDPSTRRAVLTVLHPGQSNHNGGQLQFGPDGMLYIGTGDGGGGGDPFRSAMNLADLRGKLLRIDPRQAGQQPYTVPANNPFVGVSGALPEIWSYGAPKPMALFVRSGHQRPQSSATSARTCTRRSTSGPPTPARGARSTSAGAASRAATSTARATRTAIRPRPTSSRRSSSTPTRPGAPARSRAATSSATRRAGSPRAVRLHGLLQREDLFERAPDPRRAGRRPDRNDRQRTVDLRRGLLRPRLRGRPG